MSEARENYDKYTRHMVDKESTIGKYISELEQQNKELKEFLHKMKYNTVSYNELHELLEKYE